MNSISIFLAVVESAHGTGHEAVAESGGFIDGILTMLHGFGITVPGLIAQGLNFLIVAGILWYFAFKPVMATMAEREATIAKGLSDAEKAKQQLESAELEKAEKLKEANAAAQKILQEAKTQADEFAVKQKEVLDGELSEKRRRADEAIELEREKVLNEARADIARLVVLTSGKVLQKELSEEERTRLNSAAAREMTSAQ